MSHVGLGVIIGLLGGNEQSEAAFDKSKGQKICRLRLAENKLRFEFENGYQMDIFDDGQSCCESRYMTTDDKLSDFEDAELLSVEVRAVESTKEDGWATHEVAFLVVTTTKGAFTCETHNIHNGYYGGFVLVVRDRLAYKDGES